ncbi:MAG: glycosyltransferase family 2 protein [Hyphomonadaceae bacterium]
MSARRVGVAIVSYNTKRWWPRLKAALETQTLRDFNVIVIDNASRAEERLVARDMPANGTLVQLEENIGFAAANNRAARILDADYFVCLNPDAFPQPNWLEKIVAAADARPDAGAVGSLQLDAADEERLDGAGDEYWLGGLAYRALFRAPNTPQRPGEAFSACAAAALYRGAAFDACGGFDERFFCYSEDVDLAFRMRLLGWKIVQADDAVVAHVGGGAAGARSAFAIEYGTRNRIWTFAKNMPLGLMPVALPLHVGLCIFTLAWSFARGTVAPTLKGTFAAMRGLAPMLESRRSIQGSARASSAAIARAMIWSPLAVLARATKRGPA